MEMRLHNFPKININLDYMEAQNHAKMKLW